MEKGRNREEQSQIENRERVRRETRNVCVCARKREKQKKEEVSDRKEERERMKLSGKINRKKNERVGAFFFLALSASVALSHVTLLCYRMYKQFCQREEKLSSRRVEHVTIQLGVGLNVLVYVRVRVCACDFGK